MLVVGSRGLGGLTRLLLGSTGIQVATHSLRPVVVVRPPDAAGSAGPEAGRVVVGVDSSRSSEAAVAFAFEQAARHGLGLTALLALDMPYLDVPGRVDSIPETVLAAEHEAARTWLGESLAGWRENYPDIDVRARTQPGQAARVLLDASSGAHLLVVGSRGRGGFGSLLLGSVSHAVLHHAHRPVAVVHPTPASR